MTRSAMAPATRIFSCSAGDLIARTQLTSSRESTRAARRRRLRSGQESARGEEVRVGLGRDVHPRGVVDQAELQCAVRDPLEGVHVRAVHEVFGIPVDVVLAEVAVW